jgi:hypothetical protein
MFSGPNLLRMFEFLRGEIVKEIEGIIEWGVKCER